jgi:hypothetical protein
MLARNFLTVLKSKVKKYLFGWEASVSDPRQAYQHIRDYIHHQGTAQERQSYHRLARAAKQDIFIARKQLADDYINNSLDQLIDRDFDIGTHGGIALLSLADYPPFKAALTEARDMIARRRSDDLPSKGSLDFMASGKQDFDGNSAITKLALDPNLLIPVIRYLGVMPILFSLGISRARQTEILPSSSHLYHLDPEDITQVKVFIYLNDVDTLTGPFTVLPANVTARAVDRLGYAIGRLEDETVYQAIGHGHEKVCIGPAGTTIFCDTNRCLHFGGRIKTQPRYMLSFQYALPTSTRFPLYPGDGGQNTLIRHWLPDPNSPLEQAILGHQQVI